MIAGKSFFQWKFLSYRCGSDPCIRSSLIPSCSIMLAFETRACSIKAAIRRGALCWLGFRAYFQNHTLSKILSDAFEMLLKLDCSKATLVWEIYVPQWHHNGFFTTAPCFMFRKCSCASFVFFFPNLFLFYCFPLCKWLCNKHVTCILVSDKFCVLGFRLR